MAVRAGLCSSPVTRPRPRVIRRRAFSYSCNFQKVSREVNHAMDNPSNFLGTWDPGLGFGVAGDLVHNSIVVFVVVRGGRVVGA